jgi:hypothetical protein
MPSALLAASLLAGTIVSGGLSASGNMGEQSPSFKAQAIAFSNDFEARAFFDSSDKIETGDGSIVGADLDYVERSGLSPVLGLGFRHRMTSRWSKDSLWGHIGAQYGPFRAVFVHDFNSINKETGGEFMARFCHQHLCGEQRIGVYSYLQSKSRRTGVSSETYIGVEF